MAFGDGTLWVTAQGALEGITALSNQLFAPIPLAKTLSCVAFGEGSVWVTATTG